MLIVKLTVIFIIQWIKLHSRLDCCVFHGIYHALNGLQLTLSNFNFVVHALVFFRIISVFNLYQFSVGRNLFYFLDKLLQELTNNSLIVNTYRLINQFLKSSSVLIPFRLFSSLIRSAVVAVP